MKPREWQRDVWSGLLPSLVIVLALLTNGIWAQDFARGLSSTMINNSEDANPTTSPSVPLTSTCEECGGFSGGSIAWAVILTLIVLLCLQFVAYLIWRQYAKKLEGQHLVLLSDPEKGESAFAFDNPGFKEGSSIIQQCPDKESNNKQLKWPRWNALNTVSLGQPVKVKAMDDTYTTHPQLNVVPLRSHDFTGLGFNICGNMRDGIFVKDVLHRGPASESGRIFTGDRIDSIKISFRHMVFEDALTILSYASPYEVDLSVEPRANKKDGPGGVTVNQLLQSSPTSVANATGTQSAPRTLSHPFFKSHSITDIYKIAKTSNRRSGDPLCDTSENKPPNSLERRSKFSPATDHEKTENAKNSFLEHNCVRTPDTFTEIRLDEPDMPSRHSPNHRLETPTTSSSSPSSSSTNVKAVLAKSIKNLKDKLHHSLLNDEKDSSTSAHSTLEKKTKKKRESPNNLEKIEDGFQTLELFVPDKKESQRKAYLFEELIVQDPAPDGSDSEDPIAAKRNKRKAPKPPPGTVNDDDDDDVEMIMMMRRMESGENARSGRKMSDSQDSIKSEDSTTSGGKHSGTTIELNSSHITVHQAPADSESRKASSLGDLSRFENSTNGVVHLERAVSLDLADGSGNCGGSCGGGSAQSSKKRKAPMPPQEDCLTPYKEARLESAGSTTGGGTLKKSSVWGNLEDVIQNDCDSDADLGISGCSTPEKSEEIVTSTPFKFSATSVLRKNENGIGDFQVNSSSDWEKSEFITALNGGMEGDDTPPELPSSPMPPMSSFITEIQVVTAPRRRHGDNTVNEVIHLDSTEKFLDHVASSGVMMMNDSTNSPPLSFEDNEMAVTLSLTNDSANENEEETVNSPTSGEKDDSSKSISASVLEHVAPKPPPRSDRESFHSKVESNDTPPTTPATSPTPPATNKSPNSRPTSSASTASGKMSGGNVSITSIKGQSRIPVRASGPRSPGLTLSPSSDKRISKISRNGHSSP